MNDGGGDKVGGDPYPNGDYIGKNFDDSYGVFDDVDDGDCDEHEDVQVYAELTITCLEEGKFWIITGNLPDCCLLVYKYTCGAYLCTKTPFS